jgi:hypothetical protein
MNRCMCTHPWTCKITYIYLFFRWIIGSGAAIGALDEGLQYMKEVRINTYDSVSIDVCMNISLYTCIRWFS